MWARMKCELFYDRIDPENMTVEQFCFEEVWQNNMCKHYSTENRYRIKSAGNC